MKLFRKNRIRNKGFLKPHKKDRHSIEKSYNREVTPTEFDTENIELVKEYMEKNI